MAEKKRIWTHDKRVGLIREEGRQQYVCRGFDPKDGDLLAAAPEILDALQAITKLITPMFLKACNRAGAMKMMDPYEIQRFLQDLEAKAYPAIYKAEGRKEP